MDRVRDGVGDIAHQSGVGGVGEGRAAPCPRRHDGGGASVSDTGSVLGAVGGCVGFVLLGRWCVQHFSTRGIERRLEGLYGQVVAWQAAHDHQVETIDRRLRDVEKSAARAENEARMVSVQLVDMSRSLLGRIEQVERRIARGAAHTCTPGRHQPVIQKQTSQSSMAGRNVETGAER